MSKSAHEDLRSLGSEKTEYQFGENGLPPDPKVLERFSNPSKDRVKAGNTTKGLITAIDIRVPEFTSLCPKTRQPDFATIVIKYFPYEWCVESKSLKLYMNQFRMFGEFHEACVDRIGNDLVELLDPISLQVQGQFTPRGGIPFWPTYSYQKQNTIVGV